MPFPVILGIPWLAAVLGGLFSGLIVFFAKYLSKRLALTAAFIAASIALFSVFFAACFGLLSAISVAAPPEISIAIRFFLPSNTDVCVGAIFAAKTARWVYDWNTRVIQFRLNL